MTSITGTGSASAPLGSRTYVPLSVAWLEQLSFSFAATKQHKKDVRYVMTAQHKPSMRRWAVSRSFDEYREFQRTLARALCMGHRCEAPCPWLYTFVTSYFPKPSLFRSSSSERVIRARSDALAVYLATLQSVLLGRSSYSCRVLMEPVADALMDFICAGAVDQFPIKQWAFAGQQHRARAPPGDKANTDTAVSDEITTMDLPSAPASASITSLSSFMDTASTTASLLGHEEAAAAEATTMLQAARKVCALCDVNMEAADGRMYYTTRLPCGHRFHDECVIERLNISMSCPVCARPVTNDV